MNNDRKNDQDEAGNNSSQKNPVGEPKGSGQGNNKQTQGEPSKGKQFEGGREGFSGDRGGMGQSKDKKTANVDADDDSNTDDKE